MLGILRSSSSYNAPEVGLIEYSSSVTKTQPIANLKSMGLSRSLISRYIGDREGNCIVCGMKEALKVSNVFETIIGGVFAKSSESQ